MHAIVSLDCTWLGDRNSQFPFTSRMSGVLYRTHLVMFDTPVVCVNLFSSWISHIQCPLQGPALAVD